MYGFHHPYADTFHATCVNVSGIFQCHFSIRSVYTADVTMFESMPEARTAPPRPAVDVPMAIDIAALGVPTGG